MDMSGSGFPAVTPQELARILLIDDDAISREVLAMMLEVHGISIDTAEDGAAAIALLDQAVMDQPDLAAEGLNLPLVILMDTQMPGLSGIPLIQALRKRCRGRIIAISGSPVSEDILRATDGFLLKPIEVEALVSLLERGTPAQRDTRIDLQAVAFEEPEMDPKSHSRHSVLDPLMLGKFKAMMSEAAVREIYVATADDLRPRLLKLKAAMDAGDGPEVNRIAHAIKGGCAMVGLNQATAAAMRLETGHPTSNVPKSSTTPDAASDAAGTYASELVQLYAALEALEGMLGSDF